MKLHIESWSKKKKKIKIKSFEWKRKDSMRKEVYDIIIGSPGVENTRGVLK